jgi:hypothetical protein
VYMYYSSNNKHVLAAKAQEQFSVAVSNGTDSPST